MEDGIPRGLQHRHETCCEKGGHHRRRACMVQRWFHHRNVVSRQMDLYMTAEVVVVSGCSIKLALEFCSFFH